MGVINAVGKMVEAVDSGVMRLWMISRAPYGRLANTAMSREKNVCNSSIAEKGQGTTEYAILVGVLVVMAILAITVFRPHLQELWDAIAEGINSL